jgi:hypothetical protein
MGAGQDLCPEAEVDVSHVCVDVLGRTRGLVCEIKGRERAGWEIAQVQVQYFEQALLVCSELTGDGSQPGHEAQKEEPWGEHHVPDPKAEHLTEGRVLGYQVDMLHMFPIQRPSTLAVTNAKAIHHWYRTNTNNS